MTEARAARILGALALLGAGIVHLQQYAADAYSAIPTIGTLFVLNFASATVVAAGLLLPGPAAIRRLFALGGIGIAVGSLTALFLSETSGVFGFVEAGYRFAIVLAIVLEGATVVFLGAFLALGANGSVSPVTARRP